MYLLDTNICIEFLRGKLQYAYDSLRKMSPECYGIPAVAEAELFYGVERSSEEHRALNRMKTEALIEAFPVIPFDEQCARAYGRIRNYLQSMGEPIGPNDLLIAATALANQAVMVTNNYREFSRVPGLQVEVWEDVALPE